MVIVDAQVHIWGPDTPQRPWAPGGPKQAHRPGPLGKDELLQEMDAAQVNRVVIVPPSWEGYRNDLALEAARIHPNRFAVMGRLAIETPESRALVENWRQQSGMLGVRLTFHRGPYRACLKDGYATPHAAPTRQKGEVWKARIAQFPSPLPRRPNPTGMASKRES